MKRHQILLLLIASVSAPVQAQSFPTPDYVGGWFRTTAPDIMRGNRINEDAKRRTQPPIEDSQVRSPEVALRFEVSDTVRQRTINKMINEQARTDAAGAKQTRALFSSNDIIGQLDQAIRPMGLRADNIADAYAVWWVAAWEATNNRDAGSSATMYGAVQRQAANALLSTSQLASATDAQKQELAESLLIQAALIDAHIDVASGNPTQQAALAKAVNQGAKKMGLDLTAMDLTEQGFVPRSGQRSDAPDAVEGANPGEAGSALAANDNATTSDTGKLALYGVGGAALLAGMFALGKSFGGKG